jgi:hypothetical protein
MLDLKDIKKACGLITCETSQGASQGTGYLIRPDQVATCLHVVSGKGARRITVAFDGIEREARLRLFNKECDCAILNLEVTFDDRTPLELGGKCKWKATWDTYGFPLVAKKTGITLAGIVSDPEAEDDRMAPVLELTSPDVAAGMAAPIHGFSGSPVIVDGLVVGHLKRFLPDPKDPNRPAFGKVYATRSDCVLNLLSGGPGDPGDPGNPGPPPIDPPPPGSISARLHTKRVLDLYEKWLSEDMPKGIAALLGTESLIQLGNPTQALKLIEAAPKSVRSVQLKALALAKTGKASNIDHAIKILGRLQAGGHLDEETGGILAGRYKQKWQQTGDKRYLQKTYKVYRDTFENTRHWYPGINAAASALWLEKNIESKRIAKKVLALLADFSSAEMDQWQLASKGEAYLLMGNVPRAREYYSKAIAKSPESKESIRTMLRQARLNLQGLGKSEGVLDSIFLKRK